MASPLLFLDASALAKAYLPEPGSEIVNRLLTFERYRGRLHVSGLVQPEVLAALGRAYRRERLRSSDYRRQLRRFHSHYPAAFAVVPVTDPVLALASHLIVDHRDFRVHGADAVHLASALKLQAALPQQKRRRVLMLTSDRGMKVVARQRDLGYFDAALDHERALA